MAEQGSEAKFAEKVKLGEGKGRPKTSFACNAKNWLKVVMSSIQPGQITVWVRGKPVWDEYTRARISSMGLSMGLPPPTLYCGDDGGMVHALPVGWSFRSVFEANDTEAEGLNLSSQLLRGSQSLVPLFSGLVIIQILVVSKSQATCLMTAEKRAQNTPVGMCTCIFLFPQFPLLPKSPPMDDPTDEIRTIVVWVIGPASEH